MKVLSGPSDPASGRACALSIGNFDGVHLGHQAILARVVEQARRLRIVPAVLTFDPHPARVLAPERAPLLLSTPAQKLRLLEASCIEQVSVVNFDAELAAVPASDFVRRFLIDGLKARVICVGPDFAFGHRQAGTIETLKQFPHALEAVEVPHVTIRGTRASSTFVRRAIAEGRISKAGRLLGRWYEIEGRIVSGAGRGRNQTVPTLNLEPDNALVPPRGVYVTRVSLDSGEALDAITNIGTRPTFDGGEVSIETFVLRGVVPAGVRTARLQFLRRLRDERRFPSAAGLREQIGRDVAKASRFFRMLEAGRRAEVHSC